MAELESVIFPAGYNLQEFTAPTTQADYIYSSLKNSWIFSAAQASGGKITISDNAPPNPQKTDIWIKQLDYSMYVFNESEIAPGVIQGNWIGLTNMGITASVAVSPEPPIYTQPGALWYNSETGDLKVRYHYGADEKVWVAVTSNGLVQNAEGDILDIQAVLDNLSYRIKSLEDLEYLSI